MLLQTAGLRVVGHFKKTQISLEAKQTNNKEFQCIQVSFHAAFLEIDLFACITRHVDAALRLMRIRQFFCEARTAKMKTR